MKRQREADERERVRQREQRRAERAAQRRAKDDAAPTTDGAPSTTQPILGIDGPRSLAELRAAQTVSPSDPDLAASSDDAGDSDV